MVRRNEIIWLGISSGVMGDGHDPWGRTSGAFIGVASPGAALGGERRQAGFVVGARQATRPNFSTAMVTRAVIGAMVCSASFIDASVSLPVSFMATSSEERARVV